ncbi:phosphoribosyltransferase domain-containing protein [Streptomyces sp. UNOB3_S3]|uniref:phosphoribosyltransferase domain-containing protein n=1 Tax=Streptomyces sp. UNOB3_S3 TaxID=2871682 RepID=UPI001E4D7E27|nr:phosphoribosyltransferase domain-containing protein [Streptomyces sp. UNOB3_S3]
MRTPRKVGHDRPAHNGPAHDGPEHGGRPPALHRAAVERAAREGDAHSRYACACLIEQVLADTAACRAAPAGAHALLDEVRRTCRTLAEALAAEADGRPAAPAPDPAAFLARAMTEASATTGELWRSGTARGDARTEALLRHATDWKTPEAHGYDLADLELAHTHATAWLATTRPGTPVFVVGVRTGGSYLAPLWAAAVAGAGREAAPWTSLRPLRQAGRITLVPTETGRLPAALPPGTLVVAVDDQPDSGDTARAVHAALTHRYPRAAAVLFAAPGRVYHVDATEIRPLRQSPPVRTGPARLWQLAGDGPDGVAARLRAHGVLPDDGRAHRLVPFRGPFEETYLGHPVPDRAPGGPHRISPRNRPFTLAQDAHPGQEDTAHHFRFIGTGPHGAQCAETLDALGEFLPPGRHYLDGYLITAHEPGLRPLGPALGTFTDTERDAALRAVARYWRRLDELAGLGTVDPAVTYDPRERLGTALGRLRERLARPLPVDGAWLDRHVPRRAALGGRRGRLFRTSLPYSHQGWHWQTGAGRPGAPVTVRRFGPDWIWGGAGCLESEIASFVVETRLDGPALAALRTALADDAVLDTALALAGEALWWNVKSWLRRCPDPAEAAARRMTDELEDMARYVAALR